VSGSGISWAICKSAPRPRHVTTPVSHNSVFYRLDALPAANQQRQSIAKIETKNKTVLAESGRGNNNTTFQLKMTICTKWNNKIT